MMKLNRQSVQSHLPDWISLLLPIFYSFYDFIIFNTCIIPSWYNLDWSVQTLFLVLRYSLTALFCATLYSSKLFVYDIDCRYIHGIGLYIANQGQERGGTPTTRSCPRQLLPDYGPGNRAIGARKLCMHVWGWNFKRRRHAKCRPKLSLGGVIAPINPGESATSLFDLITDSIK